MATVSTRGGGGGSIAAGHRAVQPVARAASFAVTPAFLDRGCWQHAPNGLGVTGRAGGMDLADPPPFPKAKSPKSSREK